MGNVTVIGKAPSPQKTNMPEWICSRPDNDSTAQGAQVEDGNRFTVQTTMLTTLTKEDACVRVYKYTYTHATSTRRVWPSVRLHTESVNKLLLE